MRGEDTTGLADSIVKADRLLANKIAEHARDVIDRAVAEGKLPG